MKALFHLLLFFITLRLQAGDSLTLIKSIPIEAQLFTSDVNGNIYVIKNNNKLLKFSQDGDSLGIYNEIKKGRVTQIDARNPLRILLLFSDYNQVVVLNHMLAQKSLLQLNKLGAANVKCIANSADGTMWLYDASSASLLRVDPQLNILSNTNLRNIEEIPASPSELIEHERSLYMIDSSDGIRKFDIFGFYNTRYHFHTKQIQLVGSKLIYYSTPYLYSYDMLTLQEKKLVLPHPEDIVQVRVERGRLYILRPEQFDIYLLNE